MGTLLKDKTTVLIAIVGVMGLSAMACFKVIDGPTAAQYILGLVGIAGVRQVISGAEQSVPKDLVTGIGINGKPGV